MQTFFAIVKSKLNGDNTVEPVAFYHNEEDAHEAFSEICERFKERLGFDEKFEVALVQMNHNCSEDLQ